MARMQNSLRYVSSGCVALSGFALLDFVSSPGRGGGDALLLLGLSAFAGALQLALLVAVVALRTWRVHLRFVMIATLSLSVAVGLARTPLPLMGRVLLSEPWLRPAGDRLLLHPERRQSFGQLGLFHSRGGYSSQGVAYFSLGDGGWLGDEGLAYAPDGTAPASNSDRPALRHVYGPWWRYSIAD